MRSLYESIVSTNDIGKLSLDVFNKKVREAFKKTFEKHYEIVTKDGHEGDVLWFKYKGGHIEYSKITQQFIKDAQKFYDELKKTYKLDPLYKYADSDGPVVDIRFTEAPKQWEIELPVITMGTILCDDDKVYIRVSNYDEGIYNMLLER